MATLTSNAATAGIQPKAAHTGVQTEAFSMTGPTGGAAGDVILACKIPNGAVVLDACIRFGTRSSDQSALNVFLARPGEGSGSALASMGAQLASATGGAVLFRPTAVWQPGYKIPLTDTGVGHSLLKIGFTAGTATTSFSMNGWLTWTMEDAYL